MAYSELIKSFGKIREYMRQFYVYGFKTREEFDRGSVRSYDNERRRVESWLGEYMAFRQDAGGRRVFLSVDSRQIAGNPLYEAFRAKSFTDVDITLHFALMDALADGGAHSTRELTDGVTAILTDESTVRRKLQEYERMGLVAGEKRGRERLYRLGDTPENLAAWTDALCLMSEAAPLGVVGAYLLRRLPGARSLFRFKHHFILQALESEMLCTLLEAMGQRRAVRIVSCSAGSTALRTRTAVPLRIRVSVQEGRLYAVIWHREEQVYRLTRLDRVESVTLLEEEPAYEALEAGAQAFLRGVWGASSRGRGESEHIEMTLRVEDGEYFIRQRLEREKRCGTVEEIDAHTLRFAADVRDAGEMLPWLRTFIGRIELLTCSNPEVVSRFYADIEAMTAMYAQQEGGGADAVQ